jgi:hypothetical protein
MKAQKLVDILSVVTRYEPNAMVAVEHDKIWIAGDDASEEMATELELLGVNKDQEGWFVFV